MKFREKVMGELVGIVPRKLDVSTLLNVVRKYVDIKDEEALKREFAALVQYITEHQDGENAEMICEQLYDLAKLQHAPLSADAMTKFVARSNDIMMLLTK